MLYRFGIGLLLTQVDLYIDCSVKRVLKLPRGVFYLDRLWPVIVYDATVYIKQYLSPKPLADLNYPPPPNQFLNI